MTASVESAKDVAKVEDKGGAAKISPTDLLKTIVSGKADPAKPKVEAATERPARRPLPIDGRMAAAAAVALVVGTSFGLVAAPRERSGDALTRIEASLDASRADAHRLHSEIERLSAQLTTVRETTSAARTDMRTIAPSLGDRVAKLEQGLDKKFAALGERVARAERDQAAAAAPEKRPAPPAPATPPAAPVAATPAPKAEPAQTGSIAETKPKTETVETWALREVYDGVAMLEDRKRRLLEVAKGDLVPGVGRVEAIERRGRAWVVVTKQGVITPQTW